LTAASDDRSQSNGDITINGNKITVKAAATS